MGNLPCNCLNAPTVSPIELDPAGQDYTHFEKQLIMLTKSHEKPSKTASLKTQASQSVPVIRWDSDSEEEVDMSKPYKTAEFIQGNSESLSTQSNLFEKSQNGFRKSNQL